jgi:formate C-acetyltransferase
MLAMLATAVAELDLSPQAERLLERLHEREAANEGRLLTDPGQADAWLDAALAAYRATPGQAAGRRRATVLAEFARRMPITDDGGLLAGSQSFNPAPRRSPERARELNGLGYAATSGHIVHDYRRLLAKGVCGLREQIAAVQPRNPGEREVADSFNLALDAFAHWIRRHAAAIRPADPRRADRVERLAEHAPLTFPEALQLLWFAHVFLHAENPSVAISFGRLDQLLGPFLEADLERGRIALPEALDWLIAFFVKCCEGEESQNAVLGGVDETGTDATNAVSFLALRAMRLARTFQPSLVVRLHPGTPPAFLAAATELAASGEGNPGFMNDPAAIPALEQLGIPRERARDWSVIGCYEAAPTGDCYPNTVLGGMHLPELLNHTLAESRAGDFPAFQAEFLNRVRRHYETEVLPACEARWNHWAQHAPSPFGSVLMQGCIEHLAYLEAGAAPCNLAGINILGLGTVVDGLLASSPLPNCMPP